MKIPAITMIDEAGDDRRRRGPGLLGEPVAMPPLPDLSPFDPNADALWAMYRAAHKRAATARDLLRARLARGVPAVVPMTDGEPWASAAVANQELRRLIDAYCRADKALEDAARTLVDCLELPADGREQGVVFTLEMAPREVAR